MRAGNVRHRIDYIPMFSQHGASTHSEGVTMNVRKSLLAMALASAIVAPFAVDAASIIVIDAAPPAPVYEQMPARQGFIITPGYYRYDRYDADHRDPTWVKGDYQAERKGEHYVASEWRERDGRYHFNEGRWEQDKAK
jgi:hypothetical protein